MPLDTSRIRAICFDVDGTLSDTDDLWARRVLPLVKPLRIFFRKTPHEILARRLIMGIESPGNFVYYLLDCAGLDPLAGRVYNWINHSLLRAGSKKYQMVPGTQEILHAMAQRYPLSVVSARDKHGTQGFLHAFNLQQYFKSVATSQTCRYTKPFPDPVIWAARKMDVQPEECLMVGDTVVDIRAGKSAGAQTVGVLCGFGEERELVRSGADLILPSPVHLLDYL